MHNLKNISGISGRSLQGTLYYSRLKGQYRKHIHFLETLTSYKEQQYINIKKHVNKSIKIKLLELGGGCPWAPPVWVEALGYRSVLIYQGALCKPWISLLQHKRPNSLAKLCWNPAFRKEGSWGYVSHCAEPHQLNWAWPLAASQLRGSCLSH